MAWTPKAQKRRRSKPQSQTKPKSSLKYQFKCLNSRKARQVDMKVKKQRMNCSLLVLRIECTSTSRLSSVEVWRLTLTSLQASSLSKSFPHARHLNMRSKSTQSRLQLLWLSVASYHQGKISPLQTKKARKSSYSLRVLLQRSQARLRRICQIGSWPI